jgi:hypothetical protein
MSTFAGHTYGLHRRGRDQSRHVQRSKSSRIAHRAWWREVVLVAILYTAYDVSRGLRNGDLATADRHGTAILRAESFLHIDIERSLNVGIGHVPALAVVASYMYATLHFIVTPAVLVWLYRKHPLDYGRARTTLALATVMALVSFWLVPTTPPRLLPGSNFQGERFGLGMVGW